MEKIGIYLLIVFVGIGLFDFIVYTIKSSPKNSNLIASYPWWYLSMIGLAYLLYHFNILGL